MERQDFCSLPWCGRTGKIDMHHIIRRSQGGSDDPENLVPLCHACHMGHHDGSGRQLKFWHDPWQGLSVWDSVVGEWHRVVVADPNRDPVPFDDPPDFLDSLAVIHELLDTIAAADYYLGRNLSRAIREGGKDALQEALCDRVEPQSFGSWYSNRVLYSSLPETDDVLSMGVTHGAAVARMMKHGHSFDDLIRSYTSMPWLQFKAEYAHSARRNDGC